MCGVSDGREIVYPFSELLFETGRADVSVQGEWAAQNAVGRHRALNKADSPFVPVSYARELLPTAFTLTCSNV
jgi:hypothetical protein